jgi:hypothetical protein
MRTAIVEVHAPREVSPGNMPPSGLVDEVLHNDPIFWIIFT